MFDASVSPRLLLELVLRHLDVARALRLEHRLLRVVPAVSTSAHAFYYVRRIMVISRTNPNHQRTAIQ